MIELRPVIDVSNYTQPFTEDQLAYLLTYEIGVIIGLQDAAKARDFQQQLVETGPIARDYYVDRRGRDLTIPEPAAMVWIDIEAGCFTDDGDVNAEIADELTDGEQVGVYCNATSINATIGAHPELARWPLWYANYGLPPVFDNFVPFNGWNRPVMWQYSTAGIPKQYTGGPYDLNCDLNFREVDVITRRSADGHFIEMTDPSGFVVYRWGSSDGSSGSRQSRPRNGDVSSPDHWEWLRTRKSGLTFWSQVEGD